MSAVSAFKGTVRSEISNEMGLNVASFFFKVPKNTFDKLNSDATTLLLKIIHSPCCEQLHVETIFFIVKRK